MNTKITLTIERSIIEKAEKYALKRERSLSDLIENYLKALTDEGTGVEELTRMVKTLRGSFQLPEKCDYKEQLTDRLSEKYL